LCNGISASCKGKESEINESKDQQEKETRGYIDVLVEVSGDDGGGAVVDGHVVADVRVEVEVLKLPQSVQEGAGAHMV
jgi:hypothetical protein